MFGGTLYRWTVCANAGEIGRGLVPPTIHCENFSFIQDNTPHFSSLHELRYLGTFPFLSSKCLFNVDLESTISIIFLPPSPSQRPLLTPPVAQVFTHTTTTLMFPMHCMLGGEKYAFSSNLQVGMSSSPVNIQAREMPLSSMTIRCLARMYS